MSDQTAASRGLIAFIRVHLWQQVFPCPARMECNGNLHGGTHSFGRWRYCSLSPSSIRSQTPVQPIKVQVNEVIVPVTVTDDKGRFVSNLDAKDFRVFDEGKEQHIEFFSRDRNQPVVVGFLSI